MKERVGKRWAQEARGLMIFHTWLDIFIERGRCAGMVLTPYSTIHRPRWRCFKELTEGLIRRWTSGARSKLIIFDESPTGKRSLLKPPARLAKGRTGSYFRHCYGHTTRSKACNVHRYFDDLDPAANVAVAAAQRGAASAGK